MATIDFGIDLGTTNSAIACCRDGQVRIFSSAEGKSVTPSVVHIGSTSRLTTGNQAYDAWPADPQNTQAEFKRWMGFSDKLSFPASGKVVSAEQLSAEVLKALRADVRRATGEEVTAAVITVPAAFGALQCDATGRAAALAGLIEAPLLQEPIAAAIAYGASALGKGQRWMIFDLGGGTLDIAVVSTRNGRLAVLEHQGNNRLGGKDIDRAVAQGLLLEPLAGQFKLPDRMQQPGNYDRLFRALVRYAEQAKIALTGAESATVAIAGIGDDLAGMPIQATLTLNRADVEKQIAPVLGQCLELVKRAMEGARLSAGDIDRVVLVGGPTQMPIVRKALAYELGDKLEFSIDPMTVVARGAALYASTVERTSAAPAAQAPAAAAPALPAAKPRRGEAAVVELTLNHERAAGTLQSPVAGIFASPAVHQVKIDSQAGWSSGWLDLRQGRFAAEVTLAANLAITTFTVSARKADGSAIAIRPTQFAIASMLPMAAPPLPHTIAIELSNLDGIVTFDPVFKRHAPLPAKTRKTYRADRSLRASDLDAKLPIKFWEIEVSDDPQEKWWAGCVHIRADKLRRPLTEGAEIELTINIDKSRKMTVEVFIPGINQSFASEVFVPDPPTTRTQLQQQLDLAFERVNRVFARIYAAGRADLRDQAEMLQLKLEVIVEQLNEEAQRGNPDPDALLAPTETLRKVQLLLAQLEKQLEAERHLSPHAIRLKADLAGTARLVEDHGTTTDKQTFAGLSEQAERYLETADERGIRFVLEQVRAVRNGILHNQEWFWNNYFNHFKRNRRRFVNQALAEKWIQTADRAAESKDLPALRSAVIELQNLWPSDQLETAEERAMQSGVKKA